MTTVNLTYRRSFKVPFTAVRELEEMRSGYLFNAVVVLEADELDAGYIMHPGVIEALIQSRFDGADLNSLMTPMVPSTENVAKLIGQSVLDYLFKAEVEGDVRLLISRVIETDGNHAEVVYTY